MKYYYFKLYVINVDFGCQVQALCANYAGGDCSNLAGAVVKVREDVQCSKCQNTTANPLRDIWTTSSKYLSIEFFPRKATPGLIDNLKYPYSAHSLSVHSILLQRYKNVTIEPRNCQQITFALFLWRSSRASIHFTHRSLANPILKLRHFKPYSC